MSDENGTEPQPVEGGLPPGIKVKHRIVLIVTDDDKVGVMAPPDMPPDRTELILQRGLTYISREINVSSTAAAVVAVLDERRKRIQIGDPTRLGGARPPFPGMG